MNLFNLLAKIANKVEPIFPGTGIVSVLVLLTILISVNIGILLATILFLKKKNISESFLFVVYSFLGCLSGGFLGSIAGSLFLIIIFVFSPRGDDLFGGLYAIEILNNWSDAVVICWFLGILIGGFITAKSIIKPIDN
ncbi:MAG: hypothetical protein AAGE84_03490 [Cyanobacteria bacterium P01_G01_bin.39]